MLETLPPWLMDIVKMIGIAGAIFVIWYISHKTSASQFKLMFESAMNNFSQQYKTLNDTRATDVKMQHESLRELFDVNRAILSKMMEIKIENNRDYDLMKEITDLQRIETQLLIELKALNSSHNNSLNDLKSNLRRISCIKSD